MQLQLISAISFCYQKKMKSNGSHGYFSSLIQQNKRYGFLCFPNCHKHKRVKKFFGARKIRLVIFVLQIILFILIKQKDTSTTHGDWRDERRAHLASSSTSSQRRGCQFPGDATTRRTQRFKHYHHQVDSTQSIIKCIYIGLILHLSVDFYVLHLICSKQTTYLLPINCIRPNQLHDSIVHLLKSKVVLHRPLLCFSS